MDIASESGERRWFGTSIAVVPKLIFPRGLVTRCSTTDKWRCGLDVENAVLQFSYACVQYNVAGVLAADCFGFVHLTVQQALTNNNSQEMLQMIATSFKRYKGDTSETRE